MFSKYNKKMKMSCIYNYYFFKLVLRNNSSFSFNCVWFFPMLKNYGEFSIFTYSYFLFNLLNVTTKFTLPQKKDTAIKNESIISITFRVKHWVRTT